MSAAKGFDPLLKEIIAACGRLREASATERAAFWANMGDWQTRLDSLALQARSGLDVLRVDSGARGPDPHQAHRPEEARHALMRLHFGLPDLPGSPSVVDRFRADCDHLALRIQGTDALAADATTQQRLGLLKAKLLLVRGAAIPGEAHLAALGLLVRCYRALREDAREKKG
ncbi:MAG: hypothetical protein R3F43_03240 [bacterium]